MKKDLNKMKFEEYDFKFIDIIQLNIDTKDKLILSKHNIYMVINLYK